MANKKNDTALATLSPQAGALAVAEDIDKTDLRGKEALDRDDLVLPRLAICQSTSPEKDRDDAKFIEGLQEGDLFNTLTQTNYGRGPIDVVIIRGPLKRAVEFERGPDGKPTKKIVDFNVPWNDPRCEFTDGSNGTRQKPIATRFYEYLVYVPKTAEVALLSMSNTKIKVAKNLNSLLSYRPGAAWAGLYKVAAIKEEGGGNKWFNYKINPAGPTPPQVIADAAALFKQFEGQTLRSDDVDPDAPDAEREDGSIPY